MDGLDPAISYPHQFANDAIPVSNHPLEMTGSSHVMTALDRCVRYVNSDGGRHNTCLPIRVILPLKAASRPLGAMAHQLALQSERGGTAPQLLL